MARYLGPTILGAFADDDVTEIYLNPQDSVVRFDTRSHGRVDSGTSLDASRVEMFLNAVAASLGLTLGADEPRLEAELPALAFRGSPTARVRAARDGRAGLQHPQAAGGHLLTR